MPAAGDLGERGRGQCRSAGAAAGCRRDAGLRVRGITRVSASAGSSGDVFGLCAQIERSDDRERAWRAERGHSRQRRGDQRADVSPDHRRSGRPVCGTLQPRPRPGESEWLETQRRHPFHISIEHGDRAQQLSGRGEARGSFVDQLHDADHQQHGGGLRRKTIGQRRTVGADDARHDHRHQLDRRRGNERHSHRGGRTDLRHGRALGTVGGRRREQSGVD